MSKDDLIQRSELEMRLEIMYTLLKGAGYGLFVDRVKQLLDGIVKAIPIVKPPKSVVQIKPLVWNECLTHSGKTLIASGVSSMEGGYRIDAHLPPEKIEAKKKKYQAQYESRVRGHLLDEIVPEATSLAAAEKGGAA